MTVLFCTRCAGSTLESVKPSLDPRFPTAICTTCQLRVPVTPNEALARSILRDRASQAEIDRHNRHLLEGREVASCGRCVSAKLKRRYDQAVSS
jgi:hypothetical protein